MLTDTLGREAGVKCRAHMARLISPRKKERERERERKDRIARVINDVTFKSFCEEKFLVVFYNKQLARGLIEKG